MNSNWIRLEKVDGTTRLYVGSECVFSAQDSVYAEIMANRFKSVAEQAARHEREACSAAIWDRVRATSRELDVVRACRIVIDNLPSLVEGDVVDVSEIRRRMRKGEDWTRSVTNCLPKSQQRMGAASVHEDAKEGVAT